MECNINKRYRKKSTEKSQSNFVEFKPSTSDYEMNVTVCKSPSFQEHYIINHTEKKMQGKKFKN